MTQIYGPDVSSYQPNVDWVAVRTRGKAEFAFIKATEGRSWKDPLFNKHLAGAQKAGIPVLGAYHYGHSHGGDARAVEEARHFIRVLRDANFPKSGSFLVLDAEDVCAESKSVGQAETVSWVLRFCKTVAEEFSWPRSRMLVYTGQWWWAPRTGGSDRLAKAGFPLWVSAYQGKPGKVAGWNTHLFWQYTDRFNAPGIGPSDANLFNGGLTDLHEAAGLASGAATTPKPAVKPAVKPKPAAKPAIKMRLVKKGITSSEIMRVQRYLRHLGYEQPATGFYGKVTEGNIRAFQKKKGLVVDGIAGPKTLTALGFTPV